jgi:hypothetical protein
MPFQKGQSGNPAGKPRGAVSACTRAKNDFFKAYFKLGGLKNLMHLFEDRKWCKACGTNYPRDYDQKFCKCGELVKLIPGEITQREFFFKVLPQLMPKKADVDLKGSSVIILEAGPVNKPINSGISDEGD